MKHHQNYITTAIIVGLLYGAAGIWFLGAYFELALLSFVLVLIMGIFPEVDRTGDEPEREFAALVAAIAPIILIEFFPGIKAGGMARIALVVIGCYIFTRIVIVRALDKFTIHRGMLHSIPAAMIAFQLVYLLFWDLYWGDRLFLATAAFVGYFSHLSVDAMSNVDLLGKAFGNEQRSSPVMKLFAPTWPQNIGWYGAISLLGWMIAKEIYPSLDLYAGVRY